jgi:mono/diheme cytochrome c family protein
VAGTPRAPQIPHTEREEYTLLDIAMVVPRKNVAWQSAGLFGAPFIRLARCLEGFRVVKRLRFTLPIVLSLAVSILSGCSEEYPADLSYPLRDDPLLGSGLSAVPRHWDRPGQFPREMFASLPDAERETEAKKFLNPSLISSDGQAKLESELNEIFGTPARPTVRGLPPEVTSTLKLQPEILIEGSLRYRMYCLHCHGLTGNGRGPTAPWVNPHPRDYRPGIFKFTSTKGGNERKPRRDDLLRTLRQGIEGTSMPSFGLLPDSELEAITSYVIHLSLRGNAEFNVMQGLISETISPNDIKDEMATNLGALAQFWMTSAEEKSLIVPDQKFPFPAGADRGASVKRGYEMFMNTGDAGCIACHKDFGRQAALFFDSWGTIGKPTDLTTGVYRGGSRRIDLYWRIFNGVGGSNMPAFGPTFASADYFKKENRDGIWDLVNFLEVLPFKKMRDEYGIHID